MLKIELRTRDDAIANKLGWPTGEPEYMLIISDGKDWLLEMPFNGNDKKSIADMLEKSAMRLR